MIQKLQPKVTWVTFISYSSPVKHAQPCWNIMNWGKLDPNWSYECLLLLHSCDHWIVIQNKYPLYWAIKTKGGIFDVGFGEILRSPHLQWAGNRKFAPWFTKPSITDPTLADGRWHVGEGLLLAYGGWKKNSGASAQSSCFVAFLTSWYCS